MDDKSQLKKHHHESSAMHSVASQADEDIDDEKTLFILGAGRQKIETAQSVCGWLRFGWKKSQKKGQEYDD